jgi:thioredoxin-related protein
MVGVENPQGAALASQLLVQSVPTLVFMNAKGQVLAAEPGLHDASRLNAMYEQALRREAMTPK